MTRIVTPEEAQRLLDLMPGDREQAEYTVFDRMARYTPCHETYAAAPDLAHTVIQQAEQINRLQEQIDNTALVNEDGLKVRVGRVRKVILDEGRSPAYHRQQMERLRQEWPTLYNAIMHLVKP